jgi:hypothetical protein
VSHARSRSLDDVFSSPRIAPFRNVQVRAKLPRMLVDASAVEADAIVRAMRDVASAGRTEPLSDQDRVAIAAAHHYVFRALDDLGRAFAGSTRRGCIRANRCRATSCR